MSAADPASVLDRLRSRYPRSIDLSLERVLSLLARLGQPHERLPPVIHVAGTNGKGSTIAFLRAILNAHGYVTHVYTSPHLVRFNERIVVADHEISEEELTERLLACERHIEECPATFFEVTTAAAMLAFAATSADFVLLETGLGGRLDATNVIDSPALTIITPVSLDHQAYLGDTIAEIAREKAGILKADVPAVLSRQPAAADAVIKARAAEIGVPMIEEGVDWSTTAASDGFTYCEPAGNWSLPTPSLVGEHQVSNAGRAIAAFQRLAGVRPSRLKIALGISSTVWPARMQRLPNDSFTPALRRGWEVWLDGGHNAGAAVILAEHARTWRDRPLHLVVGLLKSKNAQDFLQCLSQHAATVTTLPIPGCADCYSAEELASIARRIGIDVEPAVSLDAAIAKICNTEPPGRILICGSLYLAGAILAGITMGRST